MEFNYYISWVSGDFSPTFLIQYIPASSHDGCDKSEEKQRNLQTNLGVSYMIDMTF